MSDGVRKEQGSRVEWRKEEAREGARSRAGGQDA